MTVAGTSGAARLRSFYRRIGVFVASVAVAIASACSGDGEAPSGVVAPGRAGISLRPSFAAVSSASSAAPINVIRLTATNVSTGQVVGTLTSPVDPNASQWSLPLDVDVTGGSAEVVVLIELLNVTGGVEHVEWSGRTEPIRVTPGQSNGPPTPVVLYQGSPDNLAVVAVEIAKPVPSVMEGQDVQLSATVQGPGSPQIFWTALDPGIATIDPAGKVHTLRSGTARFTASAGPKSDNVSLVVRQRPARIEVGPATTTLESVGAEASLTAHVLDPRGDEIAGESVTWRTLAPDVAQSLGGGRFRALRRGTATVEASVASAPTVVGTATVNVSPRVARVELNHNGQVTLRSAGETLSLRAVARDASGAEVSGVPFDWESSNTSAATVDGSGVVTAVAAGQTTIRVSTPAGGSAPETERVSASVTVSVEPTVTVVEITPGDVEFDALGSTTTFTAIGKDARGTILPGRAVSWSSTNAAVVSVDANGVARAAGNGTAHIRATIDKASATVQVRVAQRVARIVVSPSTFSFTSVGQQQRFTAAARDRNNSTVRGVTFSWSVSPSERASVDSDGLVTAVSSGTARVIATSSSGAGAADITINVPAGSGGITGRAVDASTLLPIAGALVEVMSGSSAMTSFTTSGTGQFTFTSIPAGTYDVRVSASGYSTTSSVGVVVTGDATNNIGDIALVTASQVSGSFTGYVVDATNNSPLSGVTVQLRAGNNNTTGTVLATTTTDPGGEYSFTNLPAQTYTIAASRSGYALAFRTASITTSGYTSVPSIPLAPSSGIAIVLTWGASPPDLDSHMDVPAGGSCSAFHVAYYSHGSLNSCPFANLDYDYTGGYGPETIRIAQQFSGTYHYYVYIYCCSSSFDGSNARVTVYRNGVQIGQFNPPSGQGYFWDVFKLEGSTLVPINTVGNTSPSTQARSAFNLRSTFEEVERQIRAHPKRTQRGSR